MTQPTPNTDGLELLRHDVDLDAFKLEMTNKASIDLASAITDATISRTIEGASTLTVVLDDKDRRVANSGKLGRHVDVNLDNLWFTLVGVKKSGRQLTLTFEEREVNVLRYYNSFIHAARSKVTRAQFVLRMIKEVKEIPLKWIIPELDVKQPISDLSPGEQLVDKSGQPLGDFSYDPRTAQLSREPGISTAAILTVKGVTATPEQITNADIMLRTAVSLNAVPKVQIALIAAGITESTLKNLPGGDRDSVGVLQQRPSQGWPATGNVAIDSAEFIKRATQLNQEQPNLSINDLAQGVQHSGTPTAYAEWVDEATNFVTSFGNSVTDINATPKSPTVDKGNFWYTRGTLTQDTQSTDLILTKEDSWTCMQRLANEVRWRAFVVSGIIYYVSEVYLFASKPFMTLSEDTDGVNGVDYDYVEGKRVATVTLTVELRRWSAPPGSTIELVDEGIVNGKWLVNTVSRSLYNTTATVTLKKPEPVLPEPLSTTTTQALSLATPAGTRNGASESTAGIAKGAQVVSYVRSQQGVPYLWGADDPGVAFDCSGLTQAAYSSVGISLPHNAQEQYNLGPVVSGAGALEPGDLVFFGADTNSIEHVGVYIGNGQMIDAPHTGAVVRIDDNFMNWTNPPYVGATRPWQQ